MTREQAKAVVSAIERHLDARAAAAYSSDSMLRKGEALNAYEALIAALRAIR